MRICSFMSDGRPSYGMVTDSGLIDLGAVHGARFAGLRQVLAAGALDEITAGGHADAPLLDPANVKFLPVIPDPEKILCIGINYASHIAETGRATPDHPMVFARFAVSQVGHDQPIIRPRQSSRLDFEGELAVIIGRGGRSIARAEALKHVAGYACYNDGSLRDWQRHTTQFTTGKNFPATGAFGPWMVTADDIPDPAVLNLETRLNGQVMQAAPLSDLVFDVPALIEYCSAFTALEAGDVIVTGTPGGVGLFRDPPVWMAPGDIVEVTIDGIGVLRNSIADEG